MNDGYVHCSALKIVSCLMSNEPRSISVLNVGMHPALIKTHMLTIRKHCTNGKQVSTCLRHPLPLYHGMVGGRGRSLCVCVCVCY